MVKVDLSSEMIEVGRQLLEVLDRHKFRVRACFWFYFEESERWRFVVASAEARMGGPLAGYRRIGALTRKVPGAAELLGLDTTLLTDKDPLLACLRKAVPTDPKTGGTRLARTWANGTFIAGAYIYRLPFRRKRASV
jgi:hypothetical protein